MSLQHRTVDDGRQRNAVAEIRPVQLGRFVAHSRSFNENGCNRMPSRRRTSLQVPGTPMMLIEDRFVLPGEWERSIVFRTRLDRLARDFHIHLTLRPAYAVNPLRRKQDVLTR